jgi:hypothetical protein
VPASPKTKVIILFLCLAVPYLIFVLFFGLKAAPGSANPFPPWFPWVVLTYMLSSITLASVLAPRFFRNVPRPPDAQASPYSNLAKAQTLSLILVWSCFFICGALKTVKGDFLVERALPAGAFLLAFISLFGWSLRRTWAAGRQSGPSSPPDR